MRNINYYYNELVKLSLQTNSQFKITGSCDLFFIKTKNNKPFYLGLILMFFCFSGFIIYKYCKNIWSWAFALSPIVLMYFGFNKILISTEIKIDVFNKIIEIHTQNIFTFFKKRKELIKFQEFTRSKVCKLAVDRQGFVIKNKDGNSGKVYFNSISIVSKSIEIQIIDLNNGPYWFIDEQVFIESLSQIIKRAK